MNHLYLPMELLTQDIIPNSSFETILSFYLSCKEVRNLCSQKVFLSLLAEKINISESKITTFSDFVEYGSLMLGSSLAIKYHSADLCELSGIKFGNMKLIELAQKGTDRIDYIHNKSSKELLIAAAVEGNQYEKVLKLVQDDNEKITYAVIACLICDNRDILFVLLSKYTELNWLNIAMYAIKYRRNDIYLMIHDRIKTSYHVAMMIAVEYGNIPIMETLKSCFCHISNTLLRIAVYNNQLEAIKWLYEHYEELVVPDVAYLSTIEVSQWLIRNKGYDDYEKLFKGSLTPCALERQENFQRINYSYTLLVTSGSDKDTISNLVNASLDDTIFPLYILKYLNERFPGSLDFDKIGKYGGSKEVFMWAVEQGFNNFQACDFPYNFEVFKICAEKTNSADYLKSVMENAETLISVGEIDKNIYKIFFYILDKGISTTLSNETIRQSFDDDVEDKPVSKICAAKFLTINEEQSTLLRYDYPYTIDDVLFVYRNGLY
jgi:hypothetical protein